MELQTDCTLELPNDLRTIERAVELLVARCRAVGFDCDRLSLNFRVSVTEALANAMLYGNQRDPNKRVFVEAAFTPYAVTVRVTDEGQGFDPDALRDPDKHVFVDAVFTPYAVTVRVTDEGEGFDPDTLPDPTRNPHRRRPGGRGIFLIRKLMDRVEFNERGNSITMVLEQPRQRRRAQ